MRTLHEFKTPKNGVCKNPSFTDFPEGCSVDAQNAVPWDSSGRFRLCQRSGTVALPWAQLGGGQQVMHLSQTTSVLDPFTVVPTTLLLYEPFTYSNGALSEVSPFTPEIQVVSGPLASAGTFAITVRDALGTNTVKTFNWNDTAATIQTSLRGMSGSPQYVVTGGPLSVGAITITFPGSQSQAATLIVLNTAGLTPSTGYSLVRTQSGQPTWASIQNGVTLNAPLVTSNQIAVGAFRSGKYVLPLPVGSSYSVKITCTFTGAIAAGEYALCWARMDNASAGISGGIVNTAGTWNAKVFDNGGATLATSGALAAPTVGVPFTVELRVAGDTFSVLYNGVVQATATTSAVASNTFTGWGMNAGANTGTVDDFYVYTGNPLSSVRKNQILAVSGGAGYLGDLTQVNAITGATGMLNNTPVSSASMLGYAYATDGVHYWKINLLTQATEAWTASAGSIPTNCTLFCTYRARLIAAAPRGSPHLFYASRVGDPTDWDYAASTTDPARAFAGSGITAGRIGDPIVALIPFSDDTMFVGGDHSMWCIKGDPADGGSIDIVSEAIGIVGKDAWCKSPDGVLYFVGTGGLFKVAPGGAPPENITGNNWNQYFSDVNRTTNYVSMAWDRDNQGCYVFITPCASGVTAALWYDGRTNSLWPLTFPAGHGPIMPLVYDGDAPNDRELLLAGRLGYVYFMDNSTKTDAGTAITSYAYLGPYKASDMQESMLGELDVIVADSFRNYVDADFNMDVTVQAGQSAEEAFSTPKITRTKSFSAQRATRWLARTLGAVFFIKVGNSTSGKTWSLEKILGWFEPVGLNRRK